MTKLQNVALKTVHAIETLAGLQSARDHEAFRRRAFDAARTRARAILADRRNHRLQMLATLNGEAR